jgi:porin
MYLQERLAEGKLTLLGGRLAASNGFASLPVFTNYVNYGVNPNPYSIGANDFAFFGPPPGTEWGVQASYTIIPSIQVAAGMFNTNLNSANGNNHGTDFVLQERNKGALSAVELDYLRNQDSNSPGKPGQITVGFLHNNNFFPQLADPILHSNGYSAVYVLGQQMVYRPGGAGTSQGATIWGAWTYNSSDRINPIPQFWGAGVSYLGLIPARKTDVVSLGMVGTLSSHWAPQSFNEQFLELNYQWVHSRYFTVEPHFQFLWNREDHVPRNATILGLQLAITL